MKLSNNLTLEQRMNTEWGYQFDPMQCAEILDGARRGINAELYAKPDYDNIVMREIKEVLLKNPSLEERSLKEYLDAYINRRRPMTFGFLVNECVKHSVDVHVITQLQCSNDAFSEIEMLIQENYDFSHCKTITEFMKTYHAHAKHAYENDSWFRYYRDDQAKRRQFFR